MTKQRDIVKLLYEENKEYSKVMAFVKKHIIENNPCRAYCSKQIQLDYDLPITSFGNALCAYIDYLERKSKNG